MRVVLDSNVIFSALISPEGYSNLICRAWLARRFCLITSREQLEEIRRASRYLKLRTILQPNKVGTILNNLQNAEVLENLKGVDVEIDDPNDKFLLAMALKGDADYLVTGDQKSGMFKLGKIGRSKILTPVDFSKNILY